MDAHIERLSVPMPTSPIRRAAVRHWAALVAIIVVVLVVSGAYRLHGIFGSQDQTSRPSADSPENTGFDPKRVHLQVLGNPGARATINFLDEDAQPQRVDDAPLPSPSTAPPGSSGGKRLQDQNPELSRSVSPSIGPRRRESRRR